MNRLPSEAKTEKGEKVYVCIPGSKPVQNDGVPVTPFVNWYSLELA